MTTPVAEIIVPFYRGSVARSVAFGLTMRWLYETSALFPVVVPVPMVVGGLFQKATTVNRAAERSTADILVFNDADTLGGQQKTLEAVEMILDGEADWVYPYRVYRRLTKARTSYVIESQSPGLAWLTSFEHPEGEPLVDSPAQAVFAIRREAFLDLGGYDEGFRGWWYEDLDLLERLVVSDTKGERLDGDVIHLWHGDRRADDHSPEDLPASIVAANLAYWNSRQGSRAGA